MCAWVHCVSWISAWILGAPEDVYLDTWSPGGFAHLYWGPDGCVPRCWGALGGLVSVYTVKVDQHLD